MCWHVCACVRACVRARAERNEEGKGAPLREIGGNIVSGLTIMHDKISDLFALHF